MDRTIELFLQIVRCVVCDTVPSTEITLPNEEALSALYTMSKQHDMAHIVAEGLNRTGLLPSNELGAKFRKQRFAAIYSDETKTRLLSQLGALLANASIPYIPLKGSVLRQYYPASWLRTRCDVDVLIHPADVEAACRLLRDAGYDIRKYSEHDVQIYSPEGIHIELHFALVAPDDRVDTEHLPDAWAHAAPVSEGSFEHELDDAMFYGYHIIHIAKHIRSAGCGLRPFLDLWLLDRLPSADVPGREAVLASMGLWTFTRVASEMANEMFAGVPSREPLTRGLRAMVFSGGVYGGAVMEAVNWEHRPARMLAGKIFWSRKTMKRVYPALEKRPYLYPLYHFVHWWDLLVTGTVGRKYRHFRRLRENYLDNAEDAHRLFERLGL